MSSGGVMPPCRLSRLCMRWAQRANKAKLSLPVVTPMRLPMGIACRCASVHASLRSAATRPISLSLRSASSATT